MSTKKQFTPEEIRHLRANPYTRCVTADTISYTLAFKEAVSYTHLFPLMTFHPSTRLP